MLHQHIDAQLLTSHRPPPMTVQPTAEPPSERVSPSEPTLVFKVTPVTGSTTVVSQPGAQAGAATANGAPAPIKAGTLAINETPFSNTELASESSKPLTTTNASVECDLNRESSGRPSGRSSSGPKERWSNSIKTVKNSVGLSRSFKTLRDMFGDNLVEQKQLSSFKRLGEGAFATVEAAMYTPEGGQPYRVAVKKMRPEVAQDILDVESFAKEITLLRKLKHRNIVAFVGMGSTKDGTVDRAQDGLFLVQEYMDGGTLKGIVQKQMFEAGRYYRQVDSLRWAIQITRGLKLLHEAIPMVIHRDLKLENILMKGSNVSTAEAKIADFGLAALIHPKDVELTRATFRSALCNTDLTALEAQWEGQILKRSRSQAAKPAAVGKYSSIASHRFKEVASKPPQVLHELSGRTGSLMYMAPEVYRCEPYNEKCDVFGLAIVIYELFTRYIILVAICIRGVVEELHQYAERVSGGYRPPLPEEWPQELRALLADCWHQDPHSRPSMAEVLDRLLKLQASGTIPQLDALEATVNNAICSCVLC